MDSGTVQEQFQEDFLFCLLRNNKGNVTLSGTVLVGQKGTQTMDWTSQKTVYLRWYELNMKDTTLSRAETIGTKEHGLVYFSSSVWFAELQASRIYIDIYWPGILSFLVQSHTKLGIAASVFFPNWASMGPQWPGSLGELPQVLPKLFGRSSMWKVGPLAQVLDGPGEIDAAGEIAPHFCCIWWK